MQVEIGGVGSEAGSVVGQIAERIGMGALLLVLVLLIFLFGASVYLLDEVLHQRPQWPAALPGIELVAVPVAAIATARWRVLAGRLTSFRASGIGPYLPVCMALTLVALITYLSWSWTTPLTTFGPVPQFGPLRWLGSAFTAAFTVVWLPLFPRVTATLAGMIAGPALFAVIGYMFFPAHMADANPGSDGTALAAAMVAIVATLLWVPGAIWLSHGARLGRAVRQGRRPLFHAIWLGALMLCLTIMGTDVEHLL